MKSLLLPVLLLLSCLGWSAAQQASAPPAKSPQIESPDISGMYTFLKEGEFVQVTVEDGRITGFISRYGDLDSDRGVFLDQFFDKGSLDGNKLTFVTQKVHGAWFEFKGTAERGEGKTPQDEGYRVLKGTLIQYTEDENKKPVAKSREVVFKSFPQDAGVSHAKRD